MNAKEEFIEALVELLAEFTHKTGLQITTIILDENKISDTCYELDAIQVVAK